MPRISKTDKQQRPYIFAVGRRREAVARVRLYNPASGKVDILNNSFQKGDVIVNGKPISEYFRFVSYHPKFQRIFKDAEIGNKYIFSIKVDGGGLSGQLGAIVHGIARVLDKMDTEKFHEILKKKGYFTRDPRVRERRKVGNAGKARRRKSSPKR